jgi:transposase
MNFNTFIIRFGLNPDDFKPLPVVPIPTDNGFVYLLEQKTDKIPCPYCKSDNVIIQGYYETEINCSETIHITDIIKIKMVRFKCKDCRKTYNKKLTGVVKYSNLSSQSIKMICLDLKVMNTFDQVAKIHHISKSEVINIFDENIPDEKRLPLPEILCIDEFHFTSKGNNKYCVVLIDWKSKEIIDILRTRKLDYLRDYFSQISEKERRNVKYFVSDLYDGYRTIHKEFFKNSHHIADFYHITIQLSTVVNIIRTNIMKQLDINSIEYKFMKKYWKLFISHNEKLPKTKTFRTRKGFEEPIYDLFYRCVKLNENLWNGYDCLQDLYSFKKDEHFFEAKNHFTWLIKKLKANDCSYLISVANTYEKWIIEISNAFSMHPSYKNISNSIAESTNNLIKTIIKEAYGFKNFQRFRKRCLLLLRNTKKR